ncbi:MAG: hypothetical protein ACKPHU_28155, partial [Planctomycetaceae bacterium]
MVSTSGNSGIFDSFFAFQHSPQAPRCRTHKPATGDCRRQALFISLWCESRYVNSGKLFQGLRKNQQAVNMAFSGDLGSMHQEGQQLDSAGKLG